MLSNVPRYFRLFLLNEAINSGGVFETPMTELSGAKFLTPFWSTVDARIKGLAKLSLQAKQSAVDGPCPLC